MCACVCVCVCVCVCLCVCKIDLPPLQLKVLRGVNMPPAVSPLTTRSGKKRKCNGDTAKTPVVCYAICHGMGRGLEVGV